MKKKEQVPPQKNALFTCKSRVTFDFIYVNKTYRMFVSMSAGFDNSTNCRIGLFG